MVAEAWMMPTQSSMTKHQQMPSLLASSSSKTTLFANSNQKEEDYNQDDEISSIEEITTTNRRHFFGRVATAATAASIMMATGASTTSFPLLSVANAATTATTTDSNSIDYKYYTPKPNTLKGEVIVITGGTTGLGLESAKRLSYGGATVIITSRNAEKGKKAVDEIQSYVTSKGQELSPTNSIPLNLDDFNSIREFPTLLKAQLKDNTKIDVLMNNAGVMAIPERELTMNGYERTFQSNHLGHFLLTNLCIPFLLKASNTARVINVSSSAHQIPGASGLDLNNLNGETNYGPWISYGQSKLANILFTNELNERFQAAALPIISISLHPGAVQTDLARNIIGIDKWDAMKAGTNVPSWSEQLLMNTLSKFVLTVEEGAPTQIYVSSYPNVDAGKYYASCKVSKLESYALDEKKAKQLWTLSEEMTGTKFTI